MKVFFNNSCKICRSEINLYKKENIKDIDWIDITNNSDAEKETSRNDKELLNFKCIGLILSLFPNAKIINCTREPVDNCWSIYKNFFPIKTGFVNNFTDIVKFYKLYLKTIWMIKNGKIKLIYIEKEGQKIGN